MRAFFLTSAAVAALALPAHAQQAPAAQEAAPVAGQPQTPQTAQFESAPGEIIVTATRRAQALSDVPIAVSAVTAEALQNTGATDIRQLNQISPSLLVSSTSSEAGAGVARIRGIGTVGDNPGLESSVAVFIDGVYRNRSGVGLTELGEVERIEVLRGPQGTLFGRNASAGLINIVTAQPRFEVGGTAELTYGNYDFWRVAGSVTGPVVDNVLAARLDGVFVRRDGFITDVISGRTINDRDRWLARGQLLFTPTDDLSVRLVGDYSKRREECCAASWLPFRLTTRDAQGNLVRSTQNPIAALQRGLGAVLNDNTYDRETSVTPGRGYRSDVDDWGVSAEVNWNLGLGQLTSITAYRDWDTELGQDADFNNLDILYRENQQRRFRTFSQELRLQGEAFAGLLDWLVGGYYAREELLLRDDLKYGADYDRYVNAVIGLSVPGFPGFAALQPFTQGFLQAQGVPAPAAATVAGAVQNLPPLANTGVVDDRYDQVSRNWAVFTHNVLNLTDRLSLTLGVRYTNERKTLDVDLRGNNAGCATLLGNIQALGQFTGTPLQPAAQGARQLLQGLAALPCVIPPIQSLQGSQVRREEEWSGTAVVSFRPVRDLLTYASFSRGYKAGGFNLDRSALNAQAPNLAALQFEPELVDSYEVGAKLDLREFRFNLAAFWAEFDQFQLNTFNGVNFIVENIQSCRDDLGGADRDFLPTFPNAALTGRCAPDRVRPGVRSRGVEVEAAIFPARDLAVNLGATVADTRYRNNLTGFRGQPLAPPLFNLPGQRLSNAPLYVLTQSFAWTPDIGDSGLSALAYVDWRYQSEFNTGSDLFPEKRQEGFFVMNARIGLNGPDRRWSVEAWAQNLLDEKYQQVGFNGPLQGTGTLAQTARGGPAATTMFGGFLGEPRTFGVTVRTRF